MKEIWKDVKGYEGLYQVSNLGRVKSLIRNKVLSPLNRQHGYQAVQLHGKGGNARGFKSFSIHRIVAEAFVPNPENKPEVNHINEDKADNRAENLEWTTRVENCNHGTRNRRCGDANTNNPKTSSPVKQYTLDGEYIATYPSIHEAMRNTGIAIGCIWSACEGKTKQAHGYKWRYIVK